MPKPIPLKIKHALAKGDLVLHDDVLSQYSAKEQAEILAKARYIKFAIELRKLRRAMNLSQARLAQKMKVKREFIARAESGRQNITLETIYRIGQAAGKEVCLAFR